MFIHTYTRRLADELGGGNTHIAAFSNPGTRASLELAAWCSNTFGPSGGNFGDPIEWGYRWRNGIHYGEIEFTDEQDLALFILRWS